MQRYVWKSLHDVCLKLCCTNRIRLSESTYICLSFVRRLYISENTPSMLALCVTLSSVHAQRNLDKLLIFEDRPDRDAKRGRVRRSGQTQTYGNPTGAPREATVDSYGCRYESNPGLNFSSITNKSQLLVNCVSEHRQMQHIEGKSPAVHETGSHPSWR